MDDNATLHVVTMPPDQEPIPHDDSSYTCQCAQCVAERAKLVKLGVRRTPRPLKRAA